MPNYDNPVNKNIWIQEALDEKELTNWARHFSDVAQVYIQCLDTNGAAVTEFIGSELEKDKIIELADENQVQDILYRMTDNQLEDQVIENTQYPNLKLAVVTTKVNRKPVANWLICGVLNDVFDENDYPKSALTGFCFTLSEKQFYGAVDALRDFTNILFENKLNAAVNKAQDIQNKSSKETINGNLRRAEALTDIVQLLESDDSVEKIMGRMLEIIGKFLDIDRNLIVRFKRGQDRIEALASYLKNSEISDNKSREFVSTSLLKTATKPLIFSSKSVLSSQETEEMAFMGVKSLIIMPIVINAVPSMYACFAQEEDERVWSIEEIKFVNDSVKILQSILVKRVQKNSIASSFESIETILDNVGSAVYVRDLNTGRMLFANSMMQTMFKDDIVSGKINSIISQGIKDESGASEIYYEANNKHYDMYYTKIKWVDGAPVLLCALYDITEKKNYQKKIEQQAYTDFLTGLYNRMCCERDLAKTIDEAGKRRSPGALLYLDLDDFKHINDGLGHQYGDVLLKSISHALQRIDGIENTCYRMGGDEFVIIITPDNYGKKDSIIESIKDIFAQPWFLKDADYYCTMSMGIVDYPEYGTGVHDLIKKADIAMYEAKKSGKNRIAAYAEGVDAASGKRLDMEKNMRDATTGGFKEFEVYFQPIVDISKPGTPCTGAEALIRWNSSELGFISPGEFIPLAEYLGLINPIGNYVMYDACQACKNWNDNGYPDYKVNVNLSVVQLLQTDIVEIVDRTLKETGINPRNLTLEVTESLAINDMERMKRILGQIKDLGVRIALDDFGTGYSSLNHIREIPFDVIKVDQTFIKDLEKDSYAGSFVKMVGELADAIGVNLCVEGVETREQLDILSGMPIDLIQGYYFDKPLTRKEFESKYLPLLKN